MPGLALLALAGYVGTWLAVPGLDVVGGAALVLFVPGMLAQIAAGEPQPWRSLEGVLTAVGVSLAVTLFTGLLLSALPIGLTTTSWMAGLTVASIVCLDLGYLTRRVRYGRHARPAAAPPVAGLAPFQEATPARPQGGPPRRLVRRAALLAAPAVLVATGGVAIATLAAQARTTNARYTALWVLPRPGAQRLVVGVRNHQGSTERYRLQVRFGPHHVRSRALRLDDGATRTFSLPAGSVIVRLYLVGRPGVYRIVSWGRPPA
jgi:hypothetical protein